MTNAASLCPTGRRDHSRRAAAAVEFALVAPILLAIVLGTIEFGRVMVVLDTLSNASRNGARVGVITGNANSDVTSAVNTLLSDTAISSARATTTITVNGNSVDVSTASSGDSISVTVSIPVSAISWLATPVFTKNMTLTRTCVMRHD